MSKYPRIHSYAYVLGDSRSLDTLRGPIDPARIADLQADGMDRYCESEKSEADLGICSLLRSLETAELRGSDLDLIIFCSAGLGQAGVDRNEFNVRCADHELATVPIVGMTAVGCSAAAPALRIAASLIQTDQARHIAVVTADRETLAQNRLTQLGAAILSDGAASFIVSRHANSGQLVLGSAQTADQRLRAMHRDAQVPRLLARSARKMRDVVLNALSASGVGTGDVGRIVMTNLKRSANHFVVLQAGLTTDILYEGSLARIAHVFSADPIINLLEATVEETGGAPARSSQEFTLLLSLSPYSWGAVILANP